MYLVSFFPGQVADNTFMAQNIKPGMRKNRINKAKLIPDKENTPSLHASLYESTRSKKRSISLSEGYNGNKIVVPHGLHCEAMYQSSRSKKDRSLSLQDTPVKEDCCVQ